MRTTKLPQEQERRYTLQKAYYPDVVGFTQQCVDKLCVGEVLQQSDVYFSRLLIQKLVRPEIDFFF
jgi:hypothetical protein